MCRLVELLRTIYSRWPSSAVADRLIDDAYLANEIVDIYRQSRGTDGSTRMWGQLRRRGGRVAENGWPG